ncbi:MAG: carbon-nitrogen hydrolase family protein [Candidatus Rokuibacteriota bacterium]
MARLRLSLLHLAPVTGAVAENRRLIEQGVKLAAAEGADWILTPELVVCGYEFGEVIGTVWIQPQPDPWMTTFCELVKTLGVTVFLSHPERDSSSGKLHNSVFVIDPHGQIIGRHRKIHVLNGSEGWSSAGHEIAPIVCGGLGVGVLVCADAFTPALAGTLKAGGAQILVSSAAWGPGLHEPKGEWEERSRETGLPLVVCNRTGRDRTLSFTGAQSVVVKGGRRVLARSSERSAVLTCDWDPQTMELLSRDYSMTGVLT